MSTFNESTVEQAAQSWFEEIGYAVVNGPDIAPGEPAAERDSFADVVLVDRLRDAIDRLNPTIPEEAKEDALRKVLRPESPSLVGINRRFHKMLRDGVEVEYAREDGSIAGDHVRLVDYGDDPFENDWLVVNQMTVVENHHDRRPDLLVFLNGLPLAIIELKNAADEDATIWTAFSQLETYKHQIPSLFHYNELMVVSDGLQARLGSLTASSEWFKVWRDIDDDGQSAAAQLELEVLIKGIFAPDRFLDLLQHFIVFEEDTDSDRITKIIAGYHQFHAVNQALDSTIAASRPEGDQRAGVVWHTQGSGKSFSMLFFAGRVVVHPAMNNPTLVVLTDRNDLDDQLFGQFHRCYELLRQKPIQAEDIAHLKQLLQVASGGVVFTTIQKFRPDEKGDRMPLLSDRRNIVVVADEAHRSQYDLIDGLARNMRDAMPNASFIGFTGTPIEQNDANTRAVFGDYVSVYDIQRAVRDKATVPIYYESRVAKLSLSEAELPKIDSEFDEITEGQEQDTREKIKTKWAALEALVGTEKRLKVVAEDMVDHFEKRLEAMDGKAMIVCMSRRICVDLYNEIIKLRPDWASQKHDEEVEGQQDTAVKIIMTGSASDPVDWQQHIRTKRRRKELATRFKNPKDPFRIVIVRDMWLTGFDAPCMHTMYVDKPMRGHGLMQAIARVNRVFKDKPGGLVVDYLGLADQLKQALATYTESGGKGSPSIDTAAAVAVMLEKYEVCCDMMHGFDWSKWTTGTASERIKLIPAGQEHVLQQEEGKSRFSQAVTQLSQAFALCASHEEAMRIRDDIAFFQAIRSALVKPVGERKSPEEIEHAVRQLVSKAVSADDQVIDVFTAAGLKKPDISILSDEFLAEVKGLKHKNVAAELLQKLLKDEIKEQSRRNVVQSRLFSEKLQQTLNGYHNRAIATQEVIEELIELAKEMQKAKNRGEELGLSNDEICFYDALAQSESAVDAMGVDELKVIAAELVTKVRGSVTIDWQHRVSARAKIRVFVRRILRKYGYPPDLQDEATKLVLEQAEALCSDWMT
ncbi:DEAD/DEAH box helicase [Blastopirellula marina]|uniref:Type I restriction enzyme endonuclease subunit n=1 Tax=Blastopirellula marina TaxID=124 RepID=A0A2S8FM96_9BACT|nr:MULTISPECIES: type I restriction endonuclease subunit R [Pirellulaceae]PQO33285.1 DEAD/DEAH box helicase [Blastopirellula marina]RCS52374.1 type I restriction endonuclease subunit R [Bremerella cremea]